MWLDDCTVFSHNFMLDSQSKNADQHAKAELYDNLTPKELALKFQRLSLAKAMDPEASE